MNKRIAFLLSLCWVVCCSYAQNSFSKHEVRQTMRRVADWQIAHMKEVTYDPLNWVNATFYLGLSNGHPWRSRKIRMIFILSGCGAWGHAIIGKWINGCIMQMISVLHKHIWIFIVNMEKKRC